MKDTVVKELEHNGRRAEYGIYIGGNGVAINWLEIDGIKTPLVGDGFDTEAEADAYVAERLK
jgi:hypothetical protein